MIGTSGWTLRIRLGNRDLTPKGAAARYVALQYNWCAAIKQGRFAAHQLFSCPGGDIPGFGLGKGPNPPKFGGESSTDTRIAGGVAVIAGADPKAIE